MRRATRRVMPRCLLAMLVAIIVGLGPALTAVRAQDAAPLAGPAAIASAGEAVLLREQPGWEAVALTTLADGSTLEISGAPVTAADGSSWLPVVAGGQSGYVPAGYVASAPAAVQDVPAADDVPVDAGVPAEPAPLVTDPAPEAVALDPATAAAPIGEATTTTDANLRAAPAADATIAQVLPPGTLVSVTGAAENGFVPISANGVPGWVATELLAQGTAPTSVEPPPLVAPESGAPETVAPVEASTRSRDRESTGIIWPMSGGEWEVVQGYNNGTHTNRSGFAQYKYSLDWALVDGDTAGQPVFAPVSGTVDWVDRGSGGLLIDAGNGYGVALFHITLDGGIGRGDSVERGQRIGKISGPGGDGYMSMAHVDITCWRLTNNGHESVPFTGPNAIAGQEFPDSGGGNQHMGERVSL